MPGADNYSIERHIFVNMEIIKINKTSKPHNRKFQLMKPNKEPLAINSIENHFK